MLGRLFLLFTLGPLVELALLLYVADKVGWWVTLATVIGTGLLGAWLVRREGWRAWDRIHRDVSAGRVPTDAMLEGLFVFAGGVLLITPGVLSDLLGIALVFPPTRALVLLAAKRRFQMRATTHFHFQGEPQSYVPPEQTHDQIIDVRVIPHENPEKPGE